MRIAFLFMSLLLLAGCGTSDDKKKDSPKTDKSVQVTGDEEGEAEDKGTGEGYEEPLEDPSLEDPTQGPGPEGGMPPEGYEPTVAAAPFVTGALQELIGTYEQVENRQTKLRIDDQFLVLTNIELPIQIAQGTLNLTPRFPQHLRVKAGQNFYSTLGYYTDGNRIQDNVELRIVPQAGTSFIDVTFVLSGRQTDPCWNPCATPCFPYNPCDPCFAPYDPCMPYMPCDPCVGYGAGYSLLYRFEKVEAAGLIK